MKNFVLLLLLFFFFSCESDPIQTSVYDGVEFEQRIFKLDGMLGTNQYAPDSINTALSGLLISGSIEYTPWVNEQSYSFSDIARSIVSIDLSKFFEYE